MAGADAGVSHRDTRPAPKQRRRRTGWRRPRFARARVKGHAPNRCLPGLRRRRADAAASGQRRRRCFAAVRNERCSSHAALAHRPSVRPRTSERNGGQDCRHRVLSANSPTLCSRPKAHGRERALRAKRGAPFAATRTGSPDRTALTARVPSADVASDVGRKARGRHGWSGRGCFAPRHATSTKTTSEAYRTAAAPFRPCEGKGPRAQPMPARSAAEASRRRSGRSAPETLFCRGAKRALLQPCRPRASTERPAAQSSERGDSQDCRHRVLSANSPTLCSRPKAHGRERALRAKRGAPFAATRTGSPDRHQRTSPVRHRDGSARRSRRPFRAGPRIRMRDWP
jgi:hypothetical protein